MNPTVQLLAEQFRKLRSFCDKGISGPEADELSDSLDELWFAMSHDEQEEAVERAGVGLGESSP